ncbi:MAG: hypothetical protein AABZ71_09480, partial [Candidatus Binatota bacterium]
PNRKGGSISIDYAQRIYNLAKQKAQIHKGKGIHTLRHYAESRTMPSSWTFPLNMSGLAMANSA